MKDRNILLDILKGFAIITVVFGHAIQFNVKGNTEFFSNPFFILLYSFHMPLFMFVSGFLSFGTFDGSAVKLFKRFKTLIIPFVCWFLISYVVNYLLFFWNQGKIENFFTSLLKLFQHPDTGLWFLWVLLLNYIVLFFALQITKKYEEIIIFVILILLNHFLDKYYLYGISLLNWHLCFFLFGYISNKYNVFLKKPLQILGTLSFVIFPILVIFWTKKGIPTFANELHFSSFINEWICSVYKYAVPIFGILFFYALFDRLSKYNFPLKNFFISMGTKSLEIYSTHMNLLKFTFLLSLIGSLYLKVFITFAVVLVVTLLMQDVIKKSDYLAFLLYGKPLQKENTKK